MKVGMVVWPRWRLAAGAAALALALGSLAGGPLMAAEHGDPEPTVNWDLPMEFEPGPGWPEGWVPPEPPGEIPQRVIDYFESLKSLPVEEIPERLEMRVLDPLPAWTREYPYWWNYVPVVCGRTMYAYFHPEPDTGLLYQMTGHNYFVVLATEGPDCQFIPVRQIAQIPNPTPEEEEQAWLSLLIMEHKIWARGGRENELRDCVAYAREGTVDNIPVCFNSGYASERFDAPAYLDVEAGRVRVPIRFVSEMMGADVSWNEETQQVTIEFPEIVREVVQPEPLPGYEPSDWGVPGEYFLDGTKLKFVLNTVVQPRRTIVLTIGSDVAVVDGQEVRIDAPPVIRPPGRTMVPVRFIAEAMGAKVYWVGSEPIWPDPDGGLSGRYQVHIYTRFWPYYEYPSWFLETYGVKF